MSKQKHIKAHDHFFTKSMSRIKVAKEFFQDALPANIQEKINLNTLKPLPTRFIDNELAEGTVDLLYSVDFNGKEGYLYVLCEHQSTPDNLISLRMQKYMLRICSEHADKHPKKKLPLIYPILLYTGKKKHTAPLLFWKLFEDPELAKSFFTEPIQLIDASKVVDDQKIRGHMYAGLMLHFLHKIHEKEILPYIKEFAGIIHMISEKDFTYIQDLLLYILEKGESKEMNQVLLTFQKAVTDNNKEKIMTIAEQLIEKGKAEAMKLAHKMKIEAKQEGKLEGKLEGRFEIARKMLSEGLDDFTISKLTELKLEEIKKLKN